MRSTSSECGPTSDIGRQHADHPGMVAEVDINTTGGWLTFLLKTSPSWAEGR